MNLRLINRALLLAAVILVALVVRSALQAQQGQAPDVVRTPRPATVASIAAQLESESFYVDRVKEHDIFRWEGEGGADPTGKVVEPETARKVLDELKRRFVVVGVAWVEPRITMVHDSREGRTFFLREAQPVGDSGATVKSITRESVTITLQDEEIDL